MFVFLDRYRILERFKLRRRRGFERDPNSVKIEVLKIPKLNRRGGFERCSRSTNKRFWVILKLSSKTAKFK